MTMKFVVSRTSIRDGSPMAGASCEAAFSRRAVSPRFSDALSIEDVRRERPSDFVVGRNHRIEDGWLIRDEEAAAWMIEIATLDDLVKICCREGNIIVRMDGRYTDHANAVLPEIEIYDDYRE